MADDFDPDNLPAAHPSESKVATPASLPMSEMQMRLAAENPRDEARVFKGALSELRLNPAYADEAYYSIPYKDKKGGGKITMVEGLSIKAAMSLARRWGNCANGARIADERDDRVICQGMFFDYETNVLTMRDMSVSKRFRTHEGQTIRLDPTRLNMAILAGQSKAVRNAILATLPPFLNEAYFDLARNLVLQPPPKEGQKAETVEQRIEKGKSFFVTTLGATKNEISAIISAWMADSDGEISKDEILSRLIGLKNAVKDGQITISAAMGREEKTGAAMPQEKGAKPDQSEVVGENIS